MAGQPAGKKRKRQPTPEWEFHQALTACSRENDFAGALALYRAAAAADASVRLSAHHFNTLLHIFSNALGSGGSAASAGSAGADERSPSLVVATVVEAFRIFDHMVASGIQPSESTITSMARIAAADKVEGGNRAFELVRDMGTRHGVTPRLRTYGPALFAFCRTEEGAEMAYAVEEHMVSLGISPEEPELAALLKVSVEARREEKVYEYLHKLRRSIRCVSPSTAEIVKRWFESESSAGVGRKVWDVGQIRNAALMNGDGWHGSGWLGKGKWRVQRSDVGPEGCCSCCGEQLACVDIDRTETEMFAEAVGSLAVAREVKTNFRDFQDWLNNHADYDVIVDGANVAYYHQNFANGGFCLSQVEIVVKELLESGYGKQPLVILHNKRIIALMENHHNRQLLEEWKAQGLLYATPNGSNDDWYWLYASVKLKCLLVTNDEMRDHIFALLGRDFFLRWKERHQVKYTFFKGHVRLGMPPPYTSVIQESEMGSWHLPVDDSEDEKQQTWICITREELHQNGDEGKLSVDSHSTQSKTEKVRDLRTCSASTHMTNGSGSTPPPPPALPPTAPATGSGAPPTGSGSTPPPPTSLPPMAPPTGRVFGFGSELDTSGMLHSSHSSYTPSPEFATPAPQDEGASSTPPLSRDDMRVMIREELRFVLTEMGLGRENRPGPSASQTQQRDDDAQDVQDHGDDVDIT